MFDTEQYELLDFGHGRKLERFGDVVLDRLSPAADNATPRSSSWQSDWRFERRDSGDGQWRARGKRRPGRQWMIQHANLRFELCLTDFGHVGIFPEQAANWDWLAKRTARAKRPLKILNLFGYTGGSTLAAAREDTEVVHVDAAANIIKWARRNAEQSGLGDARIRWIHEDALKFVEREVRRDNKYDAIILDPPSYGHGPKGEVWKLSQHLPKLLQLCARLVKSRLAFLLMTCHTPGYGPAELQAFLEDTFFGHCQTGASAQQLYLTTSDGCRLPAGVVARWP